MIYSLLLVLLLLFSKYVGNYAELFENNIFSSTCLIHTAKRKKKEREKKKEKKWREKILF